MDDLDAAFEQSKRLENAVRADLTRWGMLDTSIGVAALDVVERLADSELRPAAAAMLHQRLDGYLADLRKLAPPAMTNDDVDEVGAQREARRRAAGMA